MNTSEFAKLCKVSKRTLIHYDNIGLIKPDCVLENGYREYNIVQLQKMDTIKIFQKAGYSLNEIKDFFMLSPDEIEVQLQDAKEKIRENISELEKVSRYIENKLTLYEDYKKNGSRVVEGYYEIAESYICQNDNNHFFSFLQDEYFEYSMIDSNNQIYLQKNDSVKTIGGYAFYIQIKSNVSNILTQIQQKIKEIKVDDPGKYYISIIPHAFIEDDGIAIIRVIIDKNMATRY